MPSPAHCPGSPPRLDDEEPEPGIHYEFALTDGDFRRIADLVTAATGIVVSDGKRAFIHGRLGRRLRVLGLANFAEYCDVLDGPDGNAERLVLINAITTNHTAFFREPHHFRFLADHVLPAIAQQTNPAGRRLRLWSAGCSTGEEPYTLAMILRQSALQLDDWDARILATDLDTNVLAHAAAGLYDAERVQSIPDDLRRRYATLQPDGRWSMHTSLRSLITFKPLNLLDDWPMRGPFDAIFCRNVVIYFDKPTRRSLFDRYADILKPGGWLTIGHSENLHNLSSRFELIGRTVYRRIK